MPGAAGALHWQRGLEPAEAAAVLDLAAGVAALTGSWPLSEEATDGLDRPGQGFAEHLVATRSGRVIGYATRMPEPGGNRPWVDVVAATPEAAARVLASVGGEAIIWGHGQSSAVHAAAAPLGWRAIRTLWQLERDLAADIPAAPPPSGVTIRSFREGADEGPWLALNAAAFADLPDQSGWTRAELATRTSASWFDPAGFLLAVDRDDNLLGCDWTKVHPRRCGTDPRAREPAAATLLGELYVVAVAPAHQGRGLGRILTVAGLEHLRASGLPSAILYVDAGNARAVALYHSLGFTRSDVDIAYALPNCCPRSPANAGAEK